MARANLTTLVAEFACFRKDVAVVQRRGYRRESWTYSQLMDSAAGCAGLLRERGVRTGYGFWPTQKEWGIGLRHYLYFAAVGLPAALALKAAHFTAPAPLWKIAATFLGFFWVIALSEEFFVRGVLQGWLEEWSGRPSGMTWDNVSMSGLTAGQESLRKPN